MTRLDTAQWGPDRLRVGPWRGDHTIAYVAPTPGRPPDAASIRECVAGLRRQGYVSVLTSALSPSEQRPFLSSGFTVHEHLHLLRHPLDRSAPGQPIGAATTALATSVTRTGAPGTVPPATTRRGRRRDREAVLEVDHLAFSPFWRFDRAGLDDARNATPVSRFRVAIRDGSVVGYAVTGRAGPISYLQRLAVHPDAQRCGIATMLVDDALHWATRRGARTMLVNTQEQNQPAVALYERLGFLLEPDGLDVLERELPEDGLPAGAGPAGEASS
ncbi:MAG: GNAT family N-acetyltransferase [Acidimicrobiales bacterium]